MYEKRLLPLPCTGAVTPCESARARLTEDDVREQSVLYFTIPIHLFRPAPCSLLDLKDDGVSLSYKHLLSALFYLIAKKFYLPRAHSASIPGTTQRRIRVFMEYLLTSESDASDLRIIDCAGVRFHVHLYEDINLMEALVALMRENGFDGDVPCPQPADDLEIEEPEQTKKKRKGASKNSKGPQKKRKGPPKVYEYYTKITHPFMWYNYACDYARDSISFDEFQDHTSGDASVPLHEHPLSLEGLFSWNNAVLDHVRPEQNVENCTRFPFPQAVWEIPYHVLSNHIAIWQMILPGSMQWYEQSPEEQITTLTTFRFEDQLESMFSDRFVKRNDLKDLRTVLLSKEKKIAEKNASVGEDEMAALMCAHRARSVRFLESMWNPSAYVSEPIKVMSKWMREEETWTTGPPVCVDPLMSFFGNMIARDLQCFEKILMISTTHSIFLRLLVNGFCAYRYKLDLHNNTLLLGEGAAGKSFLLDTLTALLIPGTVTKISHATDKAATIDTDNNDFIACYHELPPNLLGQDKSGLETGSSIIKDMMTSCLVTTHSIMVDHDTGRRIMTKFESEAVGVILAATNERADRIPEALSSRMQKISVNEYIRPDFTVTDMIKGNEVLEDEKIDMKQEEADFTRRWRVRQCICNMVEKMVYCGVLCDVDMTVFNMVRKSVVDYLVDNNIVYRSSSTRETKFMHQFARTLTIIHAAEKYANDPASPGYKKEFTFQNLKDIQPYLFCTEEIAMFVLTLNADQIVHTNHFKVVELLMAALYKNIIKEQGTCTERDGYYITRNVYNDFGKVYESMVTIQSAGLFKEKLSAENIKVAFNEMRKQMYKGLPIVQFADQAVSINVAYVRDNFKWDDSLARFRCRFNLRRIMQDAFYKAYANKYTRAHPKIILGTPVHPEIPFLYTTMCKEPNPARSISYLPPIAVPVPIEENKLADGYVRTGCMITYTEDYEQLRFRKFLRKCACSTQPDLWTCVPNGTAGPYPDAYIEWFNKFTKKHIVPS